MTKASCSLFIGLLCTCNVVPYGDDTLAAGFLAPVSGARIRRLFLSSVSWPLLTY